MGVGCACWVFVGGCVMRVCSWKIELFLMRHDMIHANAKWLLHCCSWSTRRESVDTIAQESKSRQSMHSNSSKPHIHFRMNRIHDPSLPSIYHLTTSPFLGAFTANQSLALPTFSSRSSSEEPVPAPALTSSNALTHHSDSYSGSLFSV